MSKWRCPVCKVIVEIKGNSITIYVNDMKFPKHVNCEVAKPLARIDTSKLEAVT